MCGRARLVGVAGMTSTLLCLHGQGMGRLEDTSLPVLSAGKEFLERIRMSKSRHPVGSTFLLGRHAAAQIQDRLSGDPRIRIKCWHWTILELTIIIMSIHTLFSSASTATLSTLAMMFSENSSSSICCILRHSSAGTDSNGIMSVGRESGAVVSVPGDLDILSSELALESSEVEGVSEIMFEVETRTSPFPVIFLAVAHQLTVE